MNKITIAALVTVAAVASSLTVLDAQGRGRMGGGMGQGMGQGMAQGPMGRRGGGPGGGPEGPMALAAELGRVGLSADQQAKVQALLEDDRDASRDAMAQLDEARRALHAAIFGTDAERGSVAQLQQQVADGEAQKLARDVKLQTAIAALLTPEQKAKLAR